jgi:hypothetical protein
VSSLTSIYHHLKDSTSVHYRYHYYHSYLSSPSHQLEPKTSFIMYFSKFITVITVALMFGSAVAVAVPDSDTLAALASPNAAQCARHGGMYS